MSESGESKTFALVQGFCHDKWHWNFLQTELDNLGHNTITFDLPITDPTKNFDDYGLVIADSLESRESVVGVFHSRAGNYGPRAVNELHSRVAGKLVVERMIFLNSSFEPDTVHALGRPRDGEVIPPRNSPASKRVTIPCSELGENMRRFDPDLVEEILYHDVEDKEVVKDAIQHLRPQNRPAREPEMLEWPDLPQHYIISEDDRMVLPEWSEYIARKWLGVEPERIPGGHSSFLARPKLLANVLVKLACQES